MTGGLGPEEPEERRSERDTESIPRTRPEAHPPYDDVDEMSTPFVGKATVGAYASGGGGGATGSPIPPGDEFPQFSEDELAGLRFDASGVPLGPRRVLPLEDEPSAMVARYLFPTERYRGEWKRHWVHLTNPLLIGVVATFGLGYFSGFLAKQHVDGLVTVAVLIWLGVVGWVAWRVFDWYFDRFILTNKRVMVVNGIITRRVAM